MVSAVSTCAFVASVARHITVAKNSFFIVMQCLMVIVLFYNTRRRHRLWHAARAFSFSHCKVSTFPLPFQAFSPPQRRVVKSLYTSLYDSLTPSAKNPTLADRNTPASDFRKPRFHSFATRSSGSARDCPQPRASSPAPPHRVPRSAPPVPPRGRATARAVSAR